MVDGAVLELPTFAAFAIDAGAVHITGLNAETSAGSGHTVDGKFDATFDFTVGPDGALTYADVELRHRRHAGSISGIPALPAYQTGTLEERADSGSGVYTGQIRTPTVVPDVQTGPRRDM